MKRSMVTLIRFLRQDLKVLLPLKYSVTEMSFT